MNARLEKRATCLTAERRGLMKRRGERMAKHCLVLSEKKRPLQAHLHEQEQGGGGRRRDWGFCWRMHSSSSWCQSATIDEQASWMSQHEDAALYERRFTAQLTPPAEQALGGRERESHDSRSK